MTTATKTRRNEKGEVLITDLRAAVKAACDSDHVRGGWTKTITKIDASKTNGYSLVGEFLNDAAVYLAPGSLILDSSTKGSRKSPSKHYCLLKVLDDGTLELIHALSDEDTRSWAVDLWEPIEQHLATDRPPHNPLSDYSDQQLRDELARRQQSNNH